MSAKHDVLHSTVLRSKTRVVGEWNFNGTVFSMAGMGEVLWYQAPDDPAPHPQYVDAEGRILPVSASTLQVMTNADGHVVDRNGTLVPLYEQGRLAGTMVHVDDVRVAVVSRENTAVDENGEEILLAPDGEIIPTGDDGVPGVKMVGGVPWAVDADGEPVAPLEKIIPLRSYRRPVSAYNFPVNKSYDAQPVPEELYEEFFPIDSIVELDRPKKRGVLVAWAAEDDDDSPIYTDIFNYSGGRFYTAREDAKYKYWTAPNKAEDIAVGGTPMAIQFGNTWQTTGTDPIYNTNLIAANFGPGGGTVSRGFNLAAGASYEMTFEVTAQDYAVVFVVMHEWSAPNNANPQINDSEYIGVKILKMLHARKDETVGHTLTLPVAENSQYQRIEFNVSRGAIVPSPRVTFTEFSLTPVTYPITGAGPRVVYDRPVKANKLVIGVDYTVDERHDKNESRTNTPVDSAVYVNVDRGDGVFVWNKVMENPVINDDGKINIYYHDGAWTQEPGADEGTVAIMGIHYVVWAMNRAKARLNVIEMSARYVKDFSDRLISWSTDTEVSESSFVLPMGTISSNVGSLTLSNHDGMFNGENEFLLDVKRLSENGEFSFTDVRNPLHKMMNTRVYFTIDTAVSDADREPDEWVRMATMSSEVMSVTDSMSLEIDLKDSSELLQRKKPGQLFFTNTKGMPVLQVIYMVLDSIGFTSVDIEANEENLSALLNHYWTTDDKTAWECLEDLCKATQTVAYFDNFDNLKFRTLRSIYHDALYMPPKMIITTDDLPQGLANIISINEGDVTDINKVNLDYVTLKEADISRSGVPVMEAVWEPDGTQVLRAGALVDHLPGTPPKANDIYSTFIRLPWDSTRTWPWEGMVQVEGEFIKYKGKEYYYYNASGKQVQKWIYSEEERKELDDQNDKKGHLNVYTGRLKITERGADGTKIAKHDARANVDLTKYSRRVKRPSVAEAVYNAGTTAHESKLRMRANGGWPYNTWHTMTHGTPDDYRPGFYGTRLFFPEGRSHVNAAGICLGMYNDYGIFVELSTTEAVENNGRKRNELVIYVRNSANPNWVTFFTEDAGTTLPVSRNAWYDLDVAVTSGRFTATLYTYGKYENITLKIGARGSTVRVLQQGLNKRGEKLRVDGVFGKATLEAVKRLQVKHTLTPDGVVGLEEWRAMGSYQQDVNGLTVYATVNGTHTALARIPSASMPPGGNGGRFGLFARGYTNVDFEYLYAFNGSEEIQPDQTGIWDRVRGGFVSDQLWKSWIYNKTHRYLIKGGKKVLRNVINQQLFFDDFGAYVHEVRDYDVKFKDDLPALYSYPYISNDRDVLCTEYNHGPFGAKFRLVNKSRQDAILKGEDTSFFGPDDAVEQHFLLYGRRLNREDTKSLSVEDRDAIRTRGVSEISISSDWIQTQEAANRVGSHIIEAMSQPVKEWDIEIFGNPFVKVGDLVTIYAPDRGVGTADTSELETLNRYVVFEASHSNDGSHTTSIRARQVIPASGYKHTRLSDVLRRNNNNFVINQYMNNITEVGGVEVPDQFEALSNTSMKTVYSSAGDGVAQITGTQAAGASPNARSVGFVPELWGMEGLGYGPGRTGLTAGHYYLFTSSVIAQTDCSVRLALEGFNTTGFNKIVAQKTVRLKKGQQTRIVLTGQFTDNNIPEVRPVLHLLKPGQEVGGTVAQTVNVYDMFFRTSDDAKAIYPIHGYASLKRP